MRAGPCSEWIHHFTYVKVETKLDEVAPHVTFKQWQKVEVDIKGKQIKKTKRIIINTQSRPDDIFPWNLTERYFNLIVCIISMSYIYISYLRKHTLLPTNTKFPLSCMNTTFGRIPKLPYFLERAILPLFNTWK